MMGELNGDCCVCLTRDAACLCFWGLVEILAEAELSRVGAGRILVSPFLLLDYRLFHA